MKRPPTYYVSVYAVTREYGGPEEGGWWYDRHVLLKAFPARTLRRAQATRRRLATRYDAIREGDLNSVLGGVDIRTYIDHLADGRPEKIIPATRPRYE